MATIKASDTYELAQSLAYSLRYSLEDASEAPEEVGYFIDSLAQDDYDAIIEAGEGSLTTELTETNTRIDLELKYENFPNNEEFGGDGIENGTEKFYLTGTNLTQSLSNSTGYGWSESTEIQGEFWKSTDEETGSGKHFIDEDGAVVATEFNLTEKNTGENSSEDGDSSFSESMKYRAVAEAECNTVTGLKQVHHAATPLPLS